MMFSGVNALMSRMLREDTLRLRAHASRFGFLALILILLLNIYNSRYFQSAAGLNFFSNLLMLNLVACFTLALNVYSSAISEEREQGTLGLLKMTGLSRVAILLGKSSFWLLITLVFLVLQLPFLALSVTMGGVSLHQVFAASLSIGAFAVLLCNYCLFCSLVCHTTRRAAFVAALTMGLYQFLPYPTSFIITGAVRPVSGTFWGEVLQPILNILKIASDTSIFLELRRICTTGYANDLISFQVVSNVLGGGIFFGLTWLLFERMTRDLEPVVQRPLQFNIRIDFWRKAPTRRLSERVWRNPFLWQEYRFVRGGNARWRQRWCAPPILAATIMGIVVGVNAWLIASGVSIRSLNTTDILWVVFGTCFWISLVLFLSESLVGSGRILGDDFLANTFSTLLILPVSIRRISLFRIAGEGLGLLPYLLWISVGGLGLLMIEPSFQNIFSEETPKLLFSVFVMFAGYLLLYHVVVWYSIIVKWGALGLAFGTLYLGMLVIVLGLSMIGYFLQNYCGLQPDVRTVQIVTSILTIFFLSFFNIMFDLLIFRRVAELGVKSAA